MGQFLSKVLLRETDLTLSRHTSLVHHKLHLRRKFMTCSPPSMKKKCQVRHPQHSWRDQPLAHVEAAKKQHDYKACI